MPDISIDITKFSDKSLFWLFSFVSILFFGLSIFLYNPIPALIPIGIIAALLIISNPRLLYFAFFFLLPFSIEVELPGGFSTDLPSEPIMLVLTGLFFVLLVWNFRKIDSGLLTHPISLLIILHVFWIAFSCLFSSHQLYSVKFFLAKFWYVVPFFFMPLILFKDIKDYRQLIKYLCIGLFISIAYVMIRHAATGFSFDSINKAVRPIYRNHVNYGILLIAVLPYLWYLLSSSRRKSVIVRLVPMLIILLAIYLTYTRAAQLCVVLAVAIYFVIRWQLVKYAVLIGLLLVILLSGYLAINNNYLDYAPEYTKAIEHKKFDNLLEATYKMEDISTVERFYRWIAGVNMIKDRPLTGFGPATFYSQYKAYTVTSYKTYVSNNPEKSGIHNYYLMTAVEQGLPGLIIFLFLALIPIFYAEDIYHKVQDNKIRTLAMAAGISYVLILIVLLINDLLEADKIGPFFFLAAAIIVFLDKKYKIAKSVEN